MSRPWRDAALVVATRATMSAVVIASGFRAVSDDDFARIVHMQEFATSPALDPTGTSWLPLPFWLSGGAMMVFGTSVSVARAVALLLAVASSLLLWRAARMLVGEGEGALWGALVATMLPWSLRLGVATVPELPAAALSVFGLATLAHTSPTQRLWGALALTAATLCRYEPWILAGCFAAYTALDAARGREARHGGAACIVMAGPILWLVNNAVRHGDALHFLARVAAYKRAVDASPTGWLDLLAGYPLSLLREEPEVCAVAVVLLIGGRTLPPAFRRVGWCLLSMIALLALAAARGGAPTHHVGRAVLAAWLLIAIAVGNGAMHALRSSSRLPFAMAVLVVLPLGAFVARPWYARLDSFIDRESEILIGRAAGREPGLVLVEVRDYGYFAIQAGTGEPQRVVLDRSVDPRGDAAASSFGSVPAIWARADDVGAKTVIAHRTPITEGLGVPIASHGALAAWRR